MSGPDLRRREEPEQAPAPSVPRETPRRVQPISLATVRAKFFRPMPMLFIGYFFFIGSETAWQLARSTIARPFVPAPTIADVKAELRREFASIVTDILANDLKPPKSETPMQKRYRVERGGPTKRDAFRQLREIASGIKARNDFLKREAEHGKPKQQKAATQAEQAIIDAAWRKDNAARYAALLERITAANPSDTRARDFRLIEALATMDDPPWSPTRNDYNFSGHRPPQHLNDLEEAEKIYDEQIARARAYAKHITRAGELLKEYRARWPFNRLDPKFGTYVRPEHSEHDTLHKDVMDTWKLTTAILIEIGQHTLGRPHPWFPIANSRKYDRDPRYAHYARYDAFRGIEKTAFSRVLAAIAAKDIDALAAALAAVAPLMLPEEPMSIATDILFAEIGRQWFQQAAYFDIKDTFPRTQRTSFGQGLPELWSDGQWREPNGQTVVPMIAREIFLARTKQIPRELR